MLRVNARLIKQTISNLKNQGRIFSNKKEKSTFKLDQSLQKVKVKLENA